MPLTPDDIEKLCDLSRLAIAPGEIGDVSAKLSGIVHLVDQLQAVDTSQVPPMAHPLDRTQRFRPDLVTEDDRHALYQGNAGMVERDLYLVPKVIE